jgi:hypothetical protein
VEDEDEADDTTERREMHALLSYYDNAPLPTMGIVW